MDYHIPKEKEGSNKETRSKLDTLLSAVDLENVLAIDKTLTVHDVPGGSVSFLFQKSSTTVLESSDEIEV